MLRLEGKTALITGGNSGIGRATAKLFAKEGAKVVICARRKELLEEAKDEILQNGGICEMFAGDVSIEKDASDMVKKTVDSFGKIDILVNAAGYFGSTDEAERFNTKEMKMQIDVNLMGPFYTSKYAFEEMKKRKQGSIINVCSIAALRAWPGYEPYSAAKGGLLAMTMVMAEDFAPLNIRANAILPGSTNSEPMVEYLKNPEILKEYTAEIPLGYIAEPEDIAYGALYLASDEARFVTGLQLVMDGGTILSSTLKG